MNAEPNTYAGVGSRQTPNEIIDVMNSIGYHLGRQGYILRSGGADGADTAFEVGCDLANGAKEIYLPWKNFNNNKSALFTPTQEAYEIASIHHPYFNNLKDAAKLLMARNTHQVLGKNCKSPCLMVVCWTIDKADGVKIKLSNKPGGTGQAIRLANTYNIPVFNLCNPKTLKMWRKWLASLPT